MLLQSVDIEIVREVDYVIDIERDEKETPRLH